MINHCVAQVARAEIWAAIRISTLQPSTTNKTEQITADNSLPVVFNLRAVKAKCTDVLPDRQCAQTA